LASNGAPRQSTPILFVNALEFPLDDAIQPFGLSMQVAQAAECVQPGFVEVRQSGFFPQLLAHGLRKEIVQGGALLGGCRFNLVEQVRSHEGR
jgi:hypothetical protein